MPLTSAADIVSVVMSSLYFVPATIAVPLNVLCLSAMRRAKLYRQSDAYILVAVLCIADVQFSVAMILLGIFRLSSIFADVKIVEMACHLLIAVPSMGFILSNLITLAMACERLHMIVAPLRYQTTGKKSIVFAVALILLITLASFIDGITDRSATKVISSCAAGTWVSKTWNDRVTLYGTYIPSVFCCAVYAALVFAYRRRQRKSRDQIQPKDSQSDRSQKIERNLTVTSVLICTVYICFTAAGTLFVTVVGPAVLQNAPVAGLTILQSGGILVSVKPLANAIVFSLRNTGVRRQIQQDWKKFRSRWCLRSNSSNGSNDRAPLQNAERGLPIAIIAQDQQSVAAF